MEPSFSRSEASGVVDIALRFVEVACEEPDQIFGGNRIRCDTEQSMLVSSHQQKLSSEISAIA